MVLPASAGLILNSPAFSNIENAVLPASAGLIPLLNDGFGPRGLGITRIRGFDSTEPGTHSRHSASITRIRGFDSWMRLLTSVMMLSITRIRGFDSDNPR